MPHATDAPTARPSRRRDDVPEVRVRMYDVGFGDAFLLFLPTPEGERTMLVDCGAHLGGASRPIATVVSDIIDSVTVNGRSRLDVVVATHRHYDHISGFADGAWAEVEVGEVWLPWTEERGDPTADGIRHRQHRLARQLVHEFAAEPDSDVHWLAVNSASNEDAETTLLRGFAGEPRRRFLPPVERAECTFTPDLLPGVRVHVLGPSHDPAVIAQLDPPSDKAFPFGFGVPATEQPVRPALFHDRYTRTPAEYRRRHPDLAAHASVDDIGELVAFDFLGAAARLEDAINGTSLVLVLEVGRQRILLAGDAEWGTWSVVLDDPEWKRLVAGTTVYKVAHHGSWNGTPRPFAEQSLRLDAVSLMSFRPVARWPSIPRASLVTELGGKGRTLIRSDQRPEAGAIAAVVDGTTVTTDDLWVQVNLPI